MKPHVRRNTYGRTARRDGASVQGQLSTWVNSIVSQTVAERDKALSANRALDLYTNDAMGHGLLESLIVEAVGIGLTPQFAPDHDTLGLPAEWASRYTVDLSRIWSNWALDCRNWCDAQRRLDIYGLQQLLYFCWKLDGIGIAQLRWKKDGLRPSPLAVLPIDPSRLVTPADAQSEPIYDGVEVDDDGMPVRVWIARPDAAPRVSPRYTRAECQPLDVWDEKTGLPKIFLVTGVRSVAEYRQDSILGPMIEELRVNRDLVGAALVRALIANLFVMFIENAGATAGADWNSRVVEIERGTILQGTNREIPHFFKHEARPDGYREMFDSIIDRLGMATSRGAENVSRKYQASYSASKASMVKAQQVNAVDHMTLVNRFCQPLLMWLVYERTLSGALPARDLGALAGDLNELAKVDWTPQPLPEIDRSRRASAIETELSTHQTTYADIYGEKSRDWRKQLRQRAQEKAYIAELEREYGVSLAFGQTAPATPQAEPGEDKETE